VALAELATSSADDSRDRPAQPRKKKLVRPRRPTARTRRELPDDYLAAVAGTPRSPARRRLTLRFGLGLVTGVALSSVGFVGFGGFGHAHAPPAAVGPAETDDATDEGVGPLAGSAEPRLRQINDDDGDVVIHVTIPDPIVANQVVRPRIEIKNKLGQPIKTAELVVTIADASGPTGLVAHPRHRGPGYAFNYTFPHPGQYVMRVFPPSVASAFEIPLDVR
jgi:hypothetical protein